MVAKRQRSRDNSDDRPALRVVRGESREPGEAYTLTFEDRAALGLVSSEEWYGLKAKELERALRAFERQRRNPFDNRAEAEVGQALWYAMQYEHAGEQAASVEQHVFVEPAEREQRLAAADAFLEHVVEVYLLPQPVAN